MAKSSDEIKELQRSINRLQRSDGTVLHLGGRAYLVQLEAVVDPDALLALLMRETVPEAEAIEGLSRSCRLAGEVRWIDGRWLGSLQRDLKILEKHSDLAGLTRQAPRLFRGRVIDRDWLAARQAQLDRLQEACAREAGAPRASTLWEAALTVVRCFHGEEAAEALAGIRERSTRLSAERRREAQERIAQVALRLEGGEPPREEPALATFLDGAAQQLRRAEQLPGRARRRRLRQVVGAVLAWPGEPGLPAAGEPEIDPAEPLVQQMRSLAAWRIAQQPSTRSPEFQERLALCLSRYGVAFPPGLESNGLQLDEPLLDSALRRWPTAHQGLAGLPLRLDQAIALLALRAPDGGDALFERHLATAGRWVADGLEIPLLHEAARLRLLTHLTDEGWDAATARAYCRWVSKLAPHYQRQGIELALTPEAFPRLRAAKHEELAVLGLCLLKHHTPEAGASPARQIALLDATLALFQKLPDKARRCLEGIELAPEGLGEKICPELAAWLQHDPGLDRYLHLCGLLGVPQAPSKSLLRDFELAARRAAELAHLESLAAPSEAQRQRIARLSSDAPPPGPGWTQRRLAERNEALATQILERRIDQVLAEVLRRAYGLSLDRITPAWRDVFRFYLSTDRNQDLLGLLLRTATAQPRRYFPPSLPRNREWLERAGERMKVEAWLHPRRRPVELGGRRFILEVEEDPVEVLRMGVPFNTCLSLEDGFNAAATVLNALDVNKRVLYLRDGAGKIVARQLIAVSRDFTFLRYRLYSAQDIPGLAQVFRDLCEEIAREAGLPLGDRGEPESLHDGFWYDDGVEPFTGAGSTPVEEYCRFLGLPVPQEAAGSLTSEVELWAALQDKDVRRFADWVSFYNRSLVQRDLAARLVATLGIERLTREFRQGLRGLLPVLLWHRMEQGPEALVRAARRLGLSSSEAGQLYDLLQTLPTGPAVMKEMAGLAVDLVKAAQTVDDHGLEHGTMYALQDSAGQLDLSLLLDLCDRLAPVWDRVVEGEPRCAECRAGVERAVLAAAEGVFLRDPDTRLVIGCLRSRQRGELAQRVALRILALFPFPRQSGQEFTPSALQAFERAPSDAPWARQALRGLAGRRPGLARSPEMLAAWLRQGASIDLASWPRPDHPPFETLGDLVFHVPALLPWLAGHFGLPEAAIDDWMPGPYELHVQRQVVTPWRKRLAREIASQGSNAERAALWLQMLEGREGTARRRDEKGDAPWPPRPEEHVDAERLRHALELIWRERGQLASAEAETHQDLARALGVLLAANIRPDLWIWWLTDLRTQTHGVLGPLLQDWIAKRLADRPRHLFTALTPTPDLILWLWGFPSLQEPLLGALSQVDTSEQVLRLHRSLREAARARSLDPRDLLDRWVLAIWRRNVRSELVATGDRELFLLVLRTVLPRTGPEEWLALYEDQDLEDSLSAALFLNELARQPAGKRRELRDLLQPVANPGPRRFWLERAFERSSSWSAQSVSPDRRISAVR